MRSGDRFPWPQRTTVLAGVLLLVAGVLLLLESAQASLAVTAVHVVPLSGPPVAIAAAVTRAAGFTVAAVGVAGEVGIVALSRAGRAALVLWGFRDLIGRAEDLLPGDVTAPDPVAATAGPVLQVLFVAAALVAAVLVVRARVLSGLARWVLLIVAVVETASALFGYLPVSVVVVVLGAANGVPLEYLEPVLTLLVAVALLLWGRTEAVKHRARTIHDAW